MALVIREGFYPYFNNRLYNPGESVPPEMEAGIAHMLEESTTKPKSTPKPSEVEK